MVYLLLLCRWLPKHLKGLKSFIRFGYITDKNHNMVLHDQSHWDQLNDPQFEEGTFRKPFKHIAAPQAAAAAPSSAAPAAAATPSVTIALGVTTGRATLPIPTTGATTPDGCIRGRTSL